MSSFINRLSSTWRALGNCWEEEDSKDKADRAKDLEAQKDSSGQENNRNEDGNQTLSPTGSNSSDETIRASGKRKGEENKNGKTGVARSSKEGQKDRRSSKIIRMMEWLSRDLPSEDSPTSGNLNDGGATASDDLDHSSLDGGFDARLDEIQGAMDELPRSIQEYRDGQSESINGKDFDAYVAWSEKQMAELRRMAREAADAEHNTRRHAQLASWDSSRLRGHDDVAMEIIFLPGLRSVQQLPRQSALIRSYNTPEPPPPHLSDGFEEPLEAKPKTIEATWHVAFVRLNLMIANVAINKVQYDNALKSIDEAMTEARASKMDHLVAKCFFWKGVVLEKLAYYEQALRAFKRAEKCRGMFVEGEWLGFHLQLVEDKLDVAAMARANSGFW